MVVQLDVSMASCLAEQTAAMRAIPMAALMDALKAEMWVELMAARWAAC